ncbi:MULTISPECIES: RNA polymerase sigma factor [Ruminococcus]|uniref:RNA polymerase sigma-70 factor, ECF subfamily n=1 Tax=Ruminococcus flavefaciens TaxID=1265 RepID=A0A1M7K6D8_RUMFL|nr:MULTISPECIES: sigma-70 family RNA polymerase sigma factor [Ruminococcus]MCR4793770.1 sigma-70 family RNA polymerase sigma factor [Ruminococcus sp.]SHM60872.1 RNA polymerase sigma-70 factor, ECF subfamily [Ruminococcus flavefaciens]
MDNGASSYHRFLAGDDEGLHEIICEYRTGLILYLNSFVQNIHTAEELTEDTFAELAIRCPKFSEKSSFKTWLYAIGRNITAKYLRKHTKLSIVPLESQEYLADEENLESTYIKGEQNRIVHRALHSLRSEYRQVLYLSYFEGISNAETALIMKKSKRQIEALIYNAKQALKSELERSGFEYEE